MKKARIVITRQCSRNCDGCCNVTSPDIRSGNFTRISSLDEIPPMDEYLITGGEPMEHPDLLLSAIGQIKMKGRGNRFRIYIYTANLLDPRVFQRAVRLSDGLHYTLHFPLQEDDLRKLSDVQTLLKWESGSFRLNIEKRITETVPIQPSIWTGGVKTFEWLNECPLPQDETLYFLNC